MSPKPLPLPPDLEGRPFSRLDGLEAGLTPGVLRHPRFRIPYRGVRSSVQLATEPESRTNYLRRLASEYLPLMRTHAHELFSHTTALVLYRAPIRLRPTQLHVTVPLPHGPARRVGVWGHNSTGEHHATILQDEEFEFPCVPPAVALIQAAPLLPFRELIVAADHMIRIRDNGSVAPIVQYEDLVALAGVSSGRGIRRLRAALEVARVGAESRMESLMHFELAKRGLDILELQAVLTSPGGAFIGRFDSMCRERRKILEYDGEQHRTDRGQYLRDLTRLEAAHGLGYAVLRLHKEDFFESVLGVTGDRMCRFLGEEPRAVPAHLVRYFAEPLW